MCTFDVKLKTHEKHVMASSRKVPSQKRRSRRGKNILSSSFSIFPRMYLVYDICYFFYEKGNQYVYSIEKKNKTKLIYEPHMSDMSGYSYIKVTHCWSTFVVPDLN